jgi:hypothetical protein
VTFGEHRGGQVGERRPRLWPNTLEVLMIRPSVLITRLLGATVAASAMLVAFSSQAFALRPDPGGRAPIPGAQLPDTATGTSSSTVLWVVLAMALIAVALVAAVVVRLRQRPLMRTGESSTTA